MIFVTVGTHEQSFDRLVKKIDELKQKEIINEDVIIQKGYSKYEPTHCKWYDLIGYEDMQKYMEEARIIITHGGPASFVAPLSLGKMPIVVPRQSQYDEHVNDHQLEFCKNIVERNFPIIVVENIDELEDKIVDYEKLTEENVKFNSNNENFQNVLIEKVKELF